MPQQIQHIHNLIDNGQPQFGVFKSVQEINHLDYPSYLISQRPVSQWRKWLKANQFVFIQLIQPPYRICLAIGTIKWATTAFCYWFHDDDQSFEIIEALRPFTFYSHFNQSPYHDAIYFHTAKLSIDIKFFAEYLTINIKSKLLDLQGRIQRGTQPLAVCSPTGRYGWTFTQKEPLFMSDGKVTFKSPASTQTSISLNNAIANLDWTLGIMRRITNWFWCSINTRLADGRHFLLNLAMGVNETGVSENACWLDGKIFYLPPVMFIRPTQNNGSWRVFHQDLGWSKVKIDLTFEPIKAYKKYDNFGMLASIFEQWIGRYSGTIRLDNQTICLSEIMGLAEDHLAKW